MKQAQRIPCSLIAVLFITILAQTSLIFAAAPQCISFDKPYPDPQLGTGSPPPELKDGQDSKRYPIVYEGVVGDSGWDGKPGSAELVLLSPSLCTWKYKRNLHNQAIYSSPAGFQGVFTLGMAYPPLFQYSYSVTDKIVTTPADCNQTSETTGGTAVASFTFGAEVGKCCDCFGIRSNTTDVFEATGQNIYARSTGSGNWAKTSLTGSVNKDGEVELAGPVFTGGSMFNNTRGRIFRMRQIQAPAVTVEAPKETKRLKVHVVVSDKIYYAVELNGKLISDYSSVSLKYKREENGTVETLGVDHPQVLKISQSSYRGKYKMAGAAPTAVIDESHNEALVTFESGYAVRVRVYDDGFALRFDLNLGGKIYIVDEEINYVFAKPRVTMYGSVGMSEYAFFGDPFYSDGEEPVIKRMLDDTSPFMPEYNLINNPQLFVDEDKTHLLTIFDVVPEDYPRMFLMRSPTAEVSVRSVFDRVHKQDKLFWGTQSGGRRDYTATEKEQYIAFTHGTRALPWRGFGVSRTAQEQAEMLLAFKLAPNPNPNVDYSYVPGHSKSTWDWGNYFLYRDPKNGNVTAEPLPTTRLYKAQIDFAAKYGIEYVNIDEGWNFPSEEDYTKVKDTLDPLVKREFNITGKFDPASGNNVPFKSPFAPNFDMKEIIDYGLQKGVKIILWVVRYPLVPGYYLSSEVVEDGYRQMREWGAAGLKIDSGAATDQKAVNAYHFIARKCSEYRLICNWHGPSLQGESRTYPHFVASEMADTGESYKFGLGLGTAVQHMTFPILRNLMNPLDYQIGETDNLPRSPETEARVKPLFWTWEDPLTAHTRMHEAALTVLIWSGINYLHDAYFKYEDLAKSSDPGDRAFVDIMVNHPGNWDESRWVEAHVPSELEYFKLDVHSMFQPEAMSRERLAINEAQIVARRKGSTWWVSGITGWAGYTGFIPLRFLDRKERYICTTYEDDFKKDKAYFEYTQDEYQRILVSQKRMRHGNSIKVCMSPAGGFMMKCERAVYY